MAGKEDEMIVGGEGWKDFSAVLHMLCHLGACWCLCMLGRFWLLPLFMVSVHPSLSAPTCPSASRPGTAQRFYRLDTMEVK